MVVFGVGVGGLAHALFFYLPVYALTFTFVGLTQRPGCSLARYKPAVCSVFARAWASTSDTCI